MQQPQPAKVKLPAYFFVFQVIGVMTLAAGVLTLFTGWREVVVDAIPYLANRSLDWFLLAMGITLVILFNVLLATTLKRHQNPQQKLHELRLDETKKQRSLEPYSVHAPMAIKPSERKMKLYASDFKRCGFLIFIWLCFSPILLTIYPATLDLANSIALNDPAQFNTVDATVLETGWHKGAVARYEFGIQPDGKLFTRSDSFGRDGLWSNIGTKDWNSIKSGNPKIRVKYLVKDPSANEPFTYPGNPVADGITGIIFFVILSLTWFFVGGGALKKFILSTRPSPPRSPV